MDLHFVNNNIYIKFKNKWSIYRNIVYEEQSLLALEEPLQQFPDF